MLKNWYAVMLKVYKLVVFQQNHILRAN